MQFYSSTYTISNTEGGETWKFSVTGPVNDTVIVATTVNNNTPVEVSIAAPTAGGSITAPVPANTDMNGKFRLTLTNGRYWLSLEGGVVWPDWTGLSGGPFVLATWSAT